jgi:Response regulator containing a CheY-like receiver domain and an HTH DNA-binding domain
MAHVLDELLTPCELRVAMAVAEGATSREAADALFVSRRTVETHLENVYRKLGIRNRTQLTRLVILRDRAAADVSA